MAESDPELAIQWESMNKCACVDVPTTISSVRPKAENFRINSNEFETCKSPQTFGDNSLTENFTTVSSNLAEGCPQ